MAASVDAIDETLDRARSEAEAHTPVRTGETRASYFTEHARPGGAGVEATWGNELGRFLFLEKGFHTRSGSFVPGQHIASRAADHEYPELASRIARRLR